MGKCCCAVGCTKRCFKGCGFHFYRFHKDSQRRNKWIAAVNKKNWEPTEYSWICSSHFVGGVDPSSPAYIPTLFDYVESPKKRKAKQNLVRYDRVQQCKRRRCEAFDREQLEREAHTRHENEREENEIQESNGSNCEGDHSLSSTSCAEILLELSQFEASCTCSTMTELTADEISDLIAERDHLKDENMMLKSDNAALCAEIAVLK